MRTKTSPTEAPPVAARLPPEKRTPLKDSAMLLGAGVAGSGLVSLIGFEPLHAVAVAGTTGVLAIGNAAHGLRARRRSDLRDRLVEGLAGPLGLSRPDRRTVKLSHWTKGWPGTPQSIVIRYGSAAVDAAKWLGQVIEIVERRTGASYKIAHHDRRRCLLKLTVTAPEPDDETAQTRRRIERTISELLGSTARVLQVEYIEGEPVMFRIRHEASTKLAVAGYRSRVERTVSTVLPGRWRAKWDLETDEATFEVRPSFPSMVYLQPIAIDPSRDVLATYDQVAIPYGVDEDGHELVWRPAIDPNLMVVGAPGTGKTALDHTVLMSCSRYGWPIWVVDGKGVEFLGFRDWPNVQTVATTVPEQVAVIERAWQLMEHRYQLIVQGRAAETDFEPLLVFVDEFADFKGNLNDWYAGVKVKGDASKPPVLSKIASIARKGRTSRVHLLFATQRPDSEYLGGETRDNFRARISMGRLSPQGATMMWQDPVTGTTIPRGCRGRGTTINDANRAVEIQTYYVPDPRKARRHNAEDDLARLDALRPDTVHHERLLIVAPETTHDLDSSEEIQPTYTDWVQAPWVRAEDRPDLDPLQNTEASGEDARVLASPLSIFGIASPARDLVRSAPNADRADTSMPKPVAAPWPAEENPPEVEVLAGYGPEIDIRVDQVGIGDLIQVDDATQEWAVVDGEIGEDPFDPDCISIPWRSDTDDEGILSVAMGERISVRRAQEEE